MELFKASKQWAMRPADERFWSLEEMGAACAKYKQSAVETNVKYADVRVEANAGEVNIIGKANIPARLTHWAFGQLSQRASAPAGYLRTLPATLAAQNINHGLAAGDGAESVNLMFHKNGEMVLRAATSDVYNRIWNSDIVARLVDTLPAGWRVPPARPAGIANERTRAATSADITLLQKSGLGISLGDPIAPAGLYASDHDCFIFMVNEESGVDDGTGHTLGRGFFLWNSEVGAASFGVTTFLYDAICGNHIVWGARDVNEIRVRHVGDAAGRRAFGGIRAELVKYADESASDLEAKIKRARLFEFGSNKIDAVNAAMAYAVKKHAPINRGQLTAAYEIAERAGRYGAPGTAWGMVNGLTELSQESTHTDARVNLDRAAGKLLEVVF